MGERDESEGPKCRAADEGQMYRRPVPSWLRSKGAQDHLHPVFVSKVVEISPSRHRNNSAKDRTYGSKPEEC